jgi:MOSC domain-containing protein YiiM
MSGEVIHIHIAPQAEAGMVSLPEVIAAAGRGLEGDRYFDRGGTWSETPGSGREVTLIESEMIEALERDTGVSLAPGESRRNITTRGVSLNALVDQEFRVGDVVLRGTRLAEPCAHLQRMVGEDAVLKGLVHRGGLRCDIVSGGTIRVGDRITTRSSCYSSLTTPPATLDSWRDKA